MIGNQSLCIGLYIISLMPLIIVLTMPFLDVFIMAMIIASIFISFLSIVTINYIISYNRLGPLINKINRENQLVWIRITKDKLLTFQVVKKGVYGQTKGIIHGKKADVINKGDFPIQLLNGNNAILVYDKMSHNANPDHAIAWKNLFKKNKVTTGRDAYYKSKKVNTKNV